MANIRRKKHELSAEHEEQRLRAENDLAYFIELVHPKRLLGSIHREIIHNFWYGANARRHQLLLLPRDHMKSALVAYRAVWELTRDPTLKILLISSTSNLATKQLKFIKDILTSERYHTFWPEMVNKQEAQREKWTEREISVDHPKRKEYNVRDPSIFTAGLTSNVVGLHCDIEILDDIVVAANAYTEEGREKVKEAYGYLSSVGGSMSRVWVVGTRYHPLDLYADLMQMEIEEFDEYGNIASHKSLYEIFERPVENVGDGSGEYLWPRAQHADGRWYGFNQQILAGKRAEYVNKTHFRAQYYNDPHDVGSAKIKRDYFQYYEPSYIHRREGKFFFKNERLAIYAAVDFAYSLNKKADYTSIVVVGVDGNNNYYVLDIDRFKTDQNIEYFNRIYKLYEKWQFRKIRAEVTAAQVTIVNALKNSVRQIGLAMSIDEFKPTRNQGAKEERINAVLQHRYENKQIWHYPGGNCQVLEEELLLSNPAHDDVKDALSCAIDLSVAPSFWGQMFQRKPNVEFHPRWGGVV